MSNCLYNMVLTCSKITRYEVLFILSLGIFNLVVGQFPPQFGTFACLFVFVSTQVNKTFSFLDVVFDNHVS